MNLFNLTKNNPKIQLNERFLHFQPYSYSATFSPFTTVQTVKSFILALTQCNSYDGFTR